MDIIDTVALQVSSNTFPQVLPCTFYVFLIYFPVSCSQVPVPSPVPNKFFSFLEVSSRLILNSFSAHSEFQSVTFHPLPYTRPSSLLHVPFPILFQSLQFLLLSYSNLLSSCFWEGTYSLHWN